MIGCGIHNEDNEDTYYNALCARSHCVYIIQQKGANSRLVISELGPFLLISPICGE
jgi:hypothetical protein